MEMDSLRNQVGNKCLECAAALLDKETVPTAGTVRTVKALVETSISIDMFNLRLAEQSRFAAAVSRQRNTGADCPRCQQFRAKDVNFCGGCGKQLKEKLVIVDYRSLAKSDQRDS